MPDFAEVKPGMLNLLIVTLMAIVGISVTKFLAVRYAHIVPDSVQALIGMV